MKYVLEFELNGLPKTTNGLQVHWRKRGQEAKKWRRLVWATVIDKRPETPLVRAHLTLTRISSTRPDFDGLASSFKHVIDGLIDGGIIVNDRHENIGQPEYQWVKGKQGQGKIRIRVEAA